MRINTVPNGNYILVVSRGAFVLCYKDPSGTVVGVRKDPVPGRLETTSSIVVPLAENQEVFPVEFAEGRGTG